MYEALIQKIEAHERYGPALARAAEAGRPLVLNYHSHAGEEGWCLSICARDENPVDRLLGRGTAAAESDLEELVHIQGFGREEDDCIPLTLPLAEALRDHYGLARAPAPYLNGRPLAG